MFSLRFKEDAIEHWAARNHSEDYLVFQSEIGPAVQKRGYMNRAEFLAMCEWKSPRTRSRCAKNSDDFIREVTQVSLAADHEQLRIQVLTLLTGVGWPTASVILHFCSAAPFPILDFRALWSLKAKPPTAYDFPFWWAYTEHCRAIAKRNHVPMRTLDRALWQYSKEKQVA